MKLKNWEKALILRLLENERFSIMQHANQTRAKEGINISKWAVSEATFINRIISKLELKTRDENEVVASDISEEQCLK